MNDNYNTGEVVSPDMASQMFGQKNIVDDVTDLSMFDAPGQAPEAPTHYESINETDNAFRRLVQETPAPERNVDTRMNTNPVQNEPVRRESFSEILSRVTQSKPVNIAPTQGTPAPAPTMSTQPNNTPVTEQNDQKANEPEWMKFFKPAEEVVADKVIPQAENKQETPVSSLPMNERLTKFFNPQEQEIINNAMIASSTALDNARSVYDAASARGMNPQEVLDRINAIKPEEVIEMLEVYSKYKQGMNNNPIPNPTPNPQQFKRSFEPTRPVPGITLGNVQNTVKEPAFSPLGQPVRRWQI